jgi:DNA-binding NtrC family response regulator
VELHLPLLRDRPGDLRLLVQHFLALHAQPGITHRLGDDAMARLAAYPFPGNVRELGMVIKRAIAFCPTGVITARDLEFTSDEGRPEAANVAPCAHLQDPEWLFTGDKPLATSIYEIVVRAVQHHGGNLTAAARQLGIDRSTIRRILGQAGTVSTLAPVRRLSRRPRSGGGQSCG